MQRKKVSSWKILVVAAAANMLAVAAQAVPDAPHDASNSIGCLTCHQMTSTYPKLLPPNGGTPVDMDDTYANRMCRTCHDGTGSTLVVTGTHSSLTMSNKYGDWTVECWVCHNEHKQEQVLNGSTYGMYIRRNINLANIKKPNGTSYGTGIKPVVFTGPTTFADDISPFNGICEACHTKTTHFRNDGTGDNHDGKAGADCVSCHNHDTGFTGGAVHNTFIADDSNTLGGTACSSCHTNYATSPETAHSACTVCHTATAPDLFDNTFATYNGQPDDDGTSMFTNLTTGGYLNVGTGRITDAGGNNINGVPAAFTKIKCGTCHAAKPDALDAAQHGGHPVTDWNYSAIVDDCLDCHADGGNGTIQGVHANDCTLCHVDAAGGNYARKIGDAANGVDGDATLAVGRAGTCLTCHPSATYTKTKIHHDTANAVATPTNGCTTACHNTTTGHAGNHNTLVAIQNPPCQGCHNAAAASGGNNVPVDSTSGNLIHDYCTSCHSNPSNDLIGTVAAPTAHTTTMNNADGTTATNNGGGTCTACHTAYFDGHEHKTAHTMPTVALCLNCHTATAVPYSDAGDVHEVSGCMTCHDASNGALKGAAVAAVGGENCQGCHTAYFNGHSHSHTMPTVALCTSCHTATAAPYTGAGQVHATSICATCHDLDATPTGALIGSATGKVGGEDCQGCHAAYFDGHDHGGNTVSPNHTESITKDALCGNCHDGIPGNAKDAITAPYTAGNEVHSFLGCMTCHSPVDGSPLSFATNWGLTWSARANGTCVTCHIDGFGSHGHSHTFTATLDCATCHNLDNTDGSNARDAIAAPFAGATEVHATLGCATCHDATTGALRSLAIGNEAATGCIDCHTDTWTVIHTGAAGVDHATRVEPAAACTTCHGNPSPATSNARDAQVTPYLVAGDVHAAGCALCHTGNNNGGLRSSGLTKADTVAKGTCTTCHAVTSTWTTIHDTATGAVTGVSHATRVDGLVTCTTCHTATAGGVAGVMPYNSGDDKVHDACATCHQATGALIAGNTTYGNQLIAKGDCGTCHTSTYFNSHTHHYGANNELSYNAAVDLAQEAPGTPCATCHTNNDDASGTPLNSFTDILGEHTLGASTCARCHSYTNADNMNTPPLADNNLAISTAGAKTCISCHTPKIQPATHGGHDATQFAWSPSCSGCHDQAGNPDVANDIHGDGTTATCTLCHLTSSGGSGTTKVGARGDGDATLGNSAAPHAGVTCLTCHNAASPTVNGDDAFDSYGAIHHDTTTAINNNCTTCHSGGYDHTTLVADEAAGANTLYGCATCHTSAPGSGSVPTVSLTDPMVHDACRTCHTFRAAPNMDGDLRTLAAASKGVPAGKLPTGATILGGADGGGTCVACHSNGTVDSYHHSNANTPIGNCDWCHEDPRLTAPQSGFTKPPELTPSRVPTQLLCIECHMAPLNHNGGGTNGIPVAVSGTNVSNTRVTAWASSTMTIYAFDKGSDARKTATSWKTSYPRTTVHQVTNTVSKIDNWGICLGCHDGTASRVAAGAAQVNPIHAMPTTINPRQNYCLTADVTGVGLAMYLPGRSTYNNISNINYYGDYFKPRATRPRTTQNIRNVAWTGASENCGDLTAGTYSRTWQYNKNARSAGQTMYGTSSTYSTITIPNPWGAGSTFQNYYVQNWPQGQDSAAVGDNLGPDAPTGIPTFEVTRPITPSTDQIAVDGDNVKVVSAVWNGTNTLTVTATNSDGCGSLNLVYPSGGTQVVNGFSGTGPCTATYGLANLSGGTTVDVTTDNTTGLNVIGYPITQP